MVKMIFKHFFHWGMAIIFGFLVVNFICFAYERPANCKSTPNGAAAFVRQPGAVFVHGTEGYSIARVDKNGFLNPDKELADSYVLMLGASHTSAREIPSSKRYSELVDDYFNDDNFLHVYNIGNEGNFLPGQIKHFKAAMQAYPNADVVTVEIYSTDYSVDEIREKMDQVEYDPNDSALIYKNATFVKRLKTFIRYNLPLAQQTMDQIEAYKKANSAGSRVDYDTPDYEEAINDALSLVRSEYDGPLVFIYHPEIMINPDGSISLVYSQTWDLFYEACVNNGIDVIDSGEDFLNYYELNHRLPYGFFNTTMGNGHLNKLGHRIIADEIIEYLEEHK